MHSTIQFVIRSSDTPLINFANSAESSLTSSSTQLTPSSSNFFAVVGPKPDKEVNFVVSVVEGSIFAGFSSFLTFSFLGAGAFLTALGFGVVFTSLADLFLGFSKFGFKGVILFYLNK